MPADHVVEGRAAHGGERDEQLIEDVDRDIEPCFVGPDRVERSGEPSEHVPCVAGQPAPHAERQLMKILENGAKVMGCIVVEENTNEERFGRGELRVGGWAGRRSWNGAGCDAYPVQSFEDRCEGDGTLRTRFGTGAFETRARKASRAVAALDVPAEPIDIVEQTTRKVEAATPQLDGRVGHRWQRELGSI